MKAIRILKPVRLLVLAAVLIMLSGTAAAAKTVALKYDRADKSYYAIYKAEKSETVSFRMSARYNGVLFVDGIRENPSTDRTGGISLTMYNAKGLRLDYKASNYVDATIGAGVSYAVSPGNYYFRVKVVKDNNYLVRAAYVKGTVVNHPKGGAAKARAYTLACSRAVSGVVSAAAYKTRKWFRFYVPAGSRPVRLRLLLNGGQGYTTVYVAGPNSGSTRKIRLKAGNETSVYKDVFLYRNLNGLTGPVPGWYYVLFTKGTGYEKYSSGEFALKWSYY